MVEIEFNYQQTKIVIQSFLTDTLQVAINKFIEKSKLNLNNIYFLSNGKNVKKTDKIESIISNLEWKNKKMVILVVDISTTTTKIKSIKSKDIICPKCKELCQYEIKDHRIKLFNCKNGHIVDNIRLNEFDASQSIDMSQIKCDKCKSKTKYDTYNNQFFICINCKMNLCPLCKQKHDQKHSIIDYDMKNYRCNKHNEETLIKYCEKCKLDLCLSCGSEHKNHKIKSYEDKLIDINILKKNFNTFKSELDKFKNNLEEIIQKYKKISEKMDIFYKINNDIINNYEYFEENKKRNYFSLLNLHAFNNFINKEIFKIKYDYKYGNNLNRMLYLYSELCDENVEIELNYKPNNDKEKNKEKVRIFGAKFINNNIYKCRILYKNKKYELKEFFEDIDPYYDRKDTIKFVLKGVNNITDMSDMFNECYLLSALPDIEKWDTSNVINMSNTFAKCRSLSSMPDISKWDTSNDIDMSYMFSGCNQMKSLIVLSNWNTSNVTNMSGLFYECNLLEFLPDISKWDVSNVNNMSYMFARCKSLCSLPDLSKCNTSNATDMSYMFYECNSLKKLPDLSKWDTSHATDLSWMFCECNSLSSLPDFSKWDTTNATCKTSMFKGLSKSVKIPSNFKE